MEQKRILVWLLGVALWALLRGLLPFLPVPLPLFPLVWFLAVVVGVALVVWLAFEAGRVFEAKWAGILGLIAAGARIGLAFLPLPKSLAAQVAFGTIADTLILAAALLLGSSISVSFATPICSRQSQSSSPSLTFGTVWLGGFVARIQQKAQEGVVIAQRVIEAATVKMPTVATAQYAHVGIPVIGRGDLFFAAFLFGLALEVRFESPQCLFPFRRFRHLRVDARPTPFRSFRRSRLTFIVLAILLPNLKSFRYTPEEKKALLIGAIFLFGSPCPFQPDGQAVVTVKAIRSIPVPCPMSPVPFFHSDTPSTGQIWNSLCPFNSALQGFPEATLSNSSKMSLPTSSIVASPSRIKPAFMSRSFLMRS
jgi:hypothetical protein